MPRFGSAVDLMQVPVQQIVPQKSATAPTTPVSGQLWVDTSVTPNKLKWYDGTSWVGADYSSLPSAYITDAMISNTAAIALSKLATNPLSRANHTGTQLAATISDIDTRVRASRLDQFAKPTNTLDFNNVSVINISAPINDGDAVNKYYADSLRAGISVKDPVRLAVTSNIAVNSAPATVDSVTPNGGDRILLAGQTDATQNGIYTYPGTGNTFARSNDAKNAGQVFDGTTVAVADGSYAGYQFIETAAVATTATPGTWSQTWSIFTMGGQTYTAGSGLTLTGTQFSITAPVSIALGGTGATTAATARANLGAVAKYATAIGAVTAGVAFNVSHNLGTQDVHVSFRTTADNKVIWVDYVCTDANTIACTADVAFAATALRCVVMG